MKTLTRMIAALALTLIASSGFAAQKAPAEKPAELGTATLETPKPATTEAKPLENPVPSEQPVNTTEKPKTEKPIAKAK